MLNHSKMFFFFLNKGMSSELLLYQFIVPTAKWNTSVDYFSICILYFLVKSKGPNKYCSSQLLLALLTLNTRNVTFPLIQISSSPEPSTVVPVFLYLTWEHSFFYIYTFVICTTTYHLHTTRKVSCDWCCSYQAFELTKWTLHFSIVDIWFEIPWSSTH